MKINCLLFQKKLSPAVMFCPIFFVTLLFFRPEASFATTKMLLFNPVRVIFTDRQRSVNVHVVNPSDAEITYTISLVTMRKGKNGKLYEPELETEEEKRIKKMIRYSPRRATIAPHTRQVVRLMVRKPKSLAPGEYQTRLRFSPQPAITSPVENSGGEALLNLDLIVHSSIPIIIQHGGIGAEVAPQSIQIKNFPQTPAGIAAEVTFSRSGNASSFGNTILSLIPGDDSGDKREIGRVLGVAIYLPNTSKTTIIPLKNVTREELSHGTIRVEYRPASGRIEKRKKRAAMSYKEFTLP